MKNSGLQDEPMKWFNLIPLSHVTGTGTDKNIFNLQHVPGRSGTQCNFLTTCHDFLHFTAHSTIIANYNYNILTYYLTSPLTKNLNKKF